MTRRHDIDALRVFAFALLILYHAGMLYVAPASDWAFHLKSTHAAELRPLFGLPNWKGEVQRFPELAPETPQSGISAVPRRAPP